MCGIVYSKDFNDKPVVNTIIKRYKDQRGRGSQGFGFFVPQKNRLTHNTKEGRILNLLQREVGSEILFHHRYPTSTGNVRNACHPFSTKDVFENNYVIVHNGVLRNEHELKRDHEKLGIKYISEQDDGRFNDSEAMAYDVASYLEGKQDSIKSSGSIAFIAIRLDKSGKPRALFFGRNSSSSTLKMKKTENSLTLSSEGEGTMIEADQLYCFVYDTKELSKRYCKIPGGYIWKQYNHSPSSYYGHKGPSKVPLSPEKRTNFFIDNTVESSIVGTSKNDDLKDTLNTIEKSIFNRGLRDARVSLLEDSNMDTAEAIVSGRIKLMVLKSRQSEIDDASMNEEEEVFNIERTIEEYLTNEDEILYLEAAIKTLEGDINRRVVRGDSSVTGFRIPTNVPYRD